MITTRHLAMEIPDYRSTGVLATNLQGHLIHNHKKTTLMKTFLFVCLIIAVIIISINGFDNPDGGGTPHSY